MQAIVRYVHIKTKSPVETDDVHTFILGIINGDILSKIPPCAAAGA